jgi:hypothetical protein
VEAKLGWRGVSGEFLIADHRGGQRVRPEGAVPVKEVEAGLRCRGGGRLKKGLRGVGRISHR